MERTTTLINRVSIARFPVGRCSFYTGDNIKINPYLLGYNNSKGKRLRLVLKHATLFGLLVSRVTNDSHNENRLVIIFAPLTIY